MTALPEKPALLFGNDEASDFQHFIQNKFRAFDDVNAAASPARENRLCTAVHSRFAFVRRPDICVRIQIFAFFGWYYLLFFTKVFNPH